MSPNLLLLPVGTPIAQLFQFEYDELRKTFRGKLIVLEGMPQKLRNCLRDLEEVLDQQSLAHWDAAQDAVDMFDARARFDDGSEHPICSLHVTSHGCVSFRLRADSNK